MMGVINPPPGEGPAGVPEPSYRPRKSTETGAIEAVREKLLGQVGPTSEYTKPGRLFGTNKLSGDALITEINQIKDPPSLKEFIKKCQRWEGADGFAGIFDTAINGENQVKGAGIVEKKNELATELEQIKQTSNALQKTLEEHTAIRDCAILKAMEQRLEDPDKKRTFKSKHEQLRKMLSPNLQSVTEKGALELKHNITASREKLQTEFPESRSDRALDLKELQAFVKAKNNDIKLLKRAQAAHTKLLNDHRTFSEKIGSPTGATASIKTVAAFRAAVEKRVIANKGTQIKILAPLSAKNINVDLNAKTQSVADDTMNLYFPPTSPPPPPKDQGEYGSLPIFSDEDENPHDSLPIPGENPTVEDDT